MPVFKRKKPASKKYIESCISFSEKSKSKANSVFNTEYTLREIQDILKTYSMDSKLIKNPVAYNKFMRFILDNIDFRLTANKINPTNFKKKLHNLELKMQMSKSNKKSKEERRRILSKFLKEEFSKNETNYILQFRRFNFIEEKVVKKIPEDKHSSRSDLISNTLAHTAQTLGVTNIEGPEIIDIYLHIKHIIKYTYY